METESPGIFACGNVLHVHDLVDYVSEEADTAGRHAALYLQKCREERREERKIPVRAMDGVRYTVPSSIRPERMEEAVTVRFRVREVYQNCYINVWLDGEQLIHRKRRIMAPGEMEKIMLTKEQLVKAADGSELQVKVEEA